MSDSIKKLMDELSVELNPMDGEKSTAWDPAHSGISFTAMQVDRVEGIALAAYRRGLSDAHMMLGRAIKDEFNDS